VSLDILAKKGLVTKRLGEPTPERGGRGKIYYTLTREGLEALERTAEFNRSLWKGFRDVKEDYRIR
jgi:DNA-binding PadR family transcriptional regulator